ncbi:MAG: hypothetical protein JWM47_3248, partial [Acidimicrobiales bacterium]|nr:hypothetical protein [Acidimicrobiales bacterium]
MTATVPPPARRATSPRSRLAPPRRVPATTRAARFLATETGVLVVLSVAVLATIIAHRYGDILPETKLDLLTDPGRFLSRATYFWDPSADLGRIQNQAVGYLWPMGPFFLLGQKLGIPPWLVQRFWLSTLLLLALWGMHAVLRRLDVGTPLTRVVGAAVYAFSPTFLAALIYQSAAQMPVAALPWIMAPLLKRDPDGSTPRGAAWRSGLAVACIGAVNGAAAILVLLVPAMWFLTRRRPISHWRLAATWTLSLLLGMAWWLGPLVLQGRYGFAFTLYTERSNLTTGTQSATEALRGTGGWLSYLVVDGHPLVRGGRAMAIDRSSIIATLLVAGVGMAGLVRRDLRERTWLIATMLVGLVATGIAFIGPLNGFFAEPARTLLDGPLAALRNVQKFAPLVRFALAVGVAHILAVGKVPAWTRIGRSSRAPRLVLVAVLVAVLIPVARSQQAGLSPDGSFKEIPSYWKEAVSWLDEQSDGDHTLLMPSSAFGEYTWGRPLDEPISGLATEPWTVRNIIPLGGTGSARLLDEFDRRLTNRELAGGTAEFLSRMDVKYVLVRNDLDRGRIFSPAPGLVRTSLSQTPGLTMVEAFGPQVGPSLLGDQLTTSFGPLSHADLSAIEIWEVDADVGRVTAYDAAATVAVDGGPDALFPLAEKGLLDGRATVMANSGSTDVPAGAWAVTDATRRRDSSHATVRDYFSYTLDADEDAPDTGKVPDDRLDAELYDQRAVAALQGAGEIRSSSYSLDNTTRFPGTGPWSAFDGQAESAWYPTTARSPIGAWVEARFDEPTTIPSATISRPPSDVARLEKVQITTDAGSKVASFAGNDQVEVTLPAGPTSTVRVTILGAVRAGSGFGSSGISEIALEGVDLSRPIVPVSTRPEFAAVDGPPILVFDRYRVDRTNRLKRDEDAVLDRQFSLDAGASFDLSLTGSPQTGPALDALVAKVRTEAGAVDPGMSVSSVWQGLPAFSGEAAHDNDLTTSWVAAVDDRRPSLTITWPNPVTLSTIRIQGPGFPAEPIGKVALESTNGSRIAEIGADGVGRFAALTVQTLQVRLSAPGEGTLSVPQPQVHGVTEIEFDSPVPPVVALDAARPVILDCGAGPVIEVDGTAVQTQVATTVGDLMSQQPALVIPCDTRLDLATGTHRIRGRSGSAFSIDGATLDPGGRAEPGTQRTTEVTKWATEDRRIDVGAGEAAILATTENANRGWSATYQGEALNPVVVDGWRQGFQLPAGAAGEVKLRFDPGSTYRLLLGVGAVLMLVLVLLSFGRVRSLFGRRRAPAPEHMDPFDTLPLALVVAIAFVVMAALAGPVCLLVPLLLLARRARVLDLVMGAALATAGFMALRSPLGSVQANTGTFSTLAQSAATVAIGALAFGLLRGGREPAGPDDDR